MNDRWKALEQLAADLLGGTRIRRVTRDGNGVFNFYDRAPDARVNDFGLVIDCKAREHALIVTQMVVVKHKYCQPGETPCVVTQTPRGIAYATVPLDWLADRLNELRRMTREDYT